jgi:hypothetical protein
MAYTALSHQVTTSWKRSVTLSPWRSIHLVLTVLFNILVFSALETTFEMYKQVPSVGPYIVPFVCLILFMVLLAGYYMWLLYRNTRGEMLKHPSDEAALPVLNASYTAFRLYVGMLGVAYILLTCANHANLH